MSASLVVAPPQSPSRLTPDLASSLQLCYFPNMKLGPTTSPRSLGSSSVKHRQQGCHIRFNHCTHRKHLAESYPINNDLLLGHYESIHLPGDLPELNSCWLFKRVTSGKPLFFINYPALGTVAATKHTEMAAIFPTSARAENQRCRH